MRYVSPRSLRRWTTWLWRWRIYRPIARPRCESCPDRPASVYYGGRWWCRAHPIMVPASAIGFRPRLTVPTRRTREREWDRLLTGASPPAGLPGASAYRSSSPAPDHLEQQIRKLAEDVRER